MTVAIAIECSQRSASVALSLEGGPILEESLADPPRSGDDLLPALDRLARRAKIEPSDISLVAVSTGPGSFTGIRIAVTVARTLALTRSAHVVGIPSALVALHSAAYSPGVQSEMDAGKPVLAILAVKGNDFWATEARRLDGHSWELTAPPGIRDAAEQEVAHLAALLADQFLPGELRAKTESAGVAVLSLAPRASACLALAHAHRMRYGPDDPAALLPLYPRRPEAVRLWEARQQS